MNNLKVAFSLFVLLFFHGCMREDLSSCLPKYNVDIQFDYHGDGDGSLFDDMIDSVNTYIFNDAGLIFKHIKKGKEDLNSGVGIRDQFPVGRYSIISFANAGELTYISDVDNYDLARVQARPLTRGASVAKSVDHIYSSITNIEVTSNNVIKEEGKFQSSHINLELYVKDGTTNDTPKIEVNHLPEKMNFKMEFDPGTTTYHPEMVYDKSKELYSCHFQTLRFTESYPVEIVIVSRGGTLTHKLDLQAFLKENNLLSVYEKQEFKIEILVEILNLGVVITIPDWDNEVITPRNSKEVNYGIFK